MMSKTSRRCGWAMAIGALGAAAQDAVDIAGLGHEPAHLAADLAEHLGREVGEIAS